MADDFERESLRAALNRVGVLLDSIVSGLEQLTVRFDSARLDKLVSKLKFAGATLQGLAAQSSVHESNLLDVLKGKVRLCAQLVRTVRDKWGAGSESVNESTSQESAVAALKTPAESPAAAESPREPKVTPVKSTVASTRAPNESRVRTLSIDYSSTNSSSDVNHFNATSNGNGADQLLSPGKARASSTSSGIFATFGSPRSEDFDHLQQAPAAAFDTLVQQQQQHLSAQNLLSSPLSPPPMPLNQANVSSPSLTTAKPSPRKQNPWRDVSLLGVARFDYDGDQKKKVLRFCRGDGFIITGEAREWFRGMLVGTSTVGIIPSAYVESLTYEDALLRLREMTEKLVAMRLERDKVQLSLDNTREKVKSAVLMAQRAVEERDAELNAAMARISELEVEVNIWQTSMAKVDTAELETREAAQSENVLLRGKVAEMEARLAVEKVVTSQLYQDSKHKDEVISELEDRIKALELQNRTLLERSDERKFHRELLQPQTSTEEPSSPTSASPPPASRMQNVQQQEQEHEHEQERKRDEGSELAQTSGAVDDDEDESEPPLEVSSTLAAELERNLRELSAATPPPLLSAPTTTTTPSVVTYSRTGTLRGRPPEEVSAAKNAVDQLLVVLDEEERSHSRVSMARPPLFGSSLQAICAADNAKVPVIVERLCEHLLKNNAQGARVQGIFRLSASKKDIEDVKERLSKGLWSNIDKLDFVLAADVLKTFLRDLGEPLLTHEFFPRWLLASKIKSRAIQIPYVRALMASLPQENIALVEYLCNFLIICIGYGSESNLSLSNAALLFAPIFLAQDTSKSPTLPTHNRKSSAFHGFTGFSPLFTRRRGGNAFADLASDAEELKQLMTAGVGVLQLLLSNFHDIWLRFHQTARPFMLYHAIKDSGAAKGQDELEFKKGNLVGVFHKVDTFYFLGECNGKVGRVMCEKLKAIDVE